jgi:quercetin dioxygenase-like cupin family protein
MKIARYKDVPADPAGEAGAAHVAIRWVITQKDGAPNFAMRVIEVEPGGYTPFHEHAWEHEVFILNGNGAVVQGDGETPVSHGNVVFVPAGEKHQFKNVGEEKFEFICLIPNQPAEG